MTTGFEVRNNGQGELELLIYDRIGADPWGGGGVSAKAVAEAIKGKKAAVIHVYINSPGGSVFDGMAIYNTLQRHKAAVHVHIDGMALSAASVVAMAGDTIDIAENAMLMIHDPWAMAMGTAGDLRDTADMLDKHKGNIIATYAARTGNDPQQIADWMSAETWFTGPEAVEHGFADAMTGAKKIAASVDLSIFKNAPATWPAAITGDPPVSADPIQESTSMSKTDPKVDTSDPQTPPTDRELFDALNGAFADKAFVTEMFAAKNDVEEARRVLAGRENERIRAEHATQAARIAELETANAALSGQVADLGARLAAASAAPATPPAGLTVPFAPPADADEGQAAWEKTWQADANLRREFMNNKNQYFAYQRAAVAGRARILQK